MGDKDISGPVEQQFKTDDADSYDAVAGYFDRYTERYTSHMPEPLLAMANVPVNGTVLDVGTGTGIIALAVSGRIGPDGKVTGIDLSDGMLKVASEKAKQKGLERQCDFIKMDAENLELADNSFDAAISLYALRHFPDPEKSVKEIFRVLKPGASIVVAVGSPPPLFSMDGVNAAVRRILSIARRSRGLELRACEFIDALVEKHIPERSSRDVAEWVEHHHGFTGSIRSLVQAAGFGKIRTGWKGQYSIIDSPEDFWLLQMTFSSIARKRIQQADEAVIEKLKEEFYRCCNEVLKKNGRLIYQTGAAIVAGVKPAA